MSKIKKLKETLLLSKEEQHRLRGSKSCRDIGFTCTGGGLPPTEPPPPPAPSCGCNCSACWGEEANWFAAGMALSGL
jgi:hypothetical protein